MTAKQDCDNSCSVSESITCELRSRPEPRKIELAELHKCDSDELLGYFADDSHYDTLVQEDCDVFVAGVKVLSFRKSLFPKLKEGSSGSPETWDYFRWVARDLYSDQRGLVAGKEIFTDPDIRISNGVLNFFKRAVKGNVESVEEALNIAEMSPDFGKFCVRMSSVKEDFPQIAEGIVDIDKALRKKAITAEEKFRLKAERGKVISQWFRLWLEGTWASAANRVESAKAAEKRFIVQQFRANKCFSNVLGALDRSTRTPYGRLTMTTLKNYEGFKEHKDIYQAACAALKETLNTPDNPRWDNLHRRFSKVRDPNYNLFGTVFTTLTLNWNFRCAMHYDANNCEGGIAVLTAITKGEYDGHYLVFPELRCAFDLRDGDFLAGDNQSLIHGNTAMIPKTPDAERVSLVFYSRERMVLMEDVECENCRKDFMKYCVENLPQKGKGHATWNGIWEGQWTSPEWLEYRKMRGLEKCSNGNWWATKPYRNKATGKVSSFALDPGNEWELLEVWTGEKVIKGDK